MREFKMHIHDQYLDLIENGNKKHEYRLNNIERQQIKVADVLVLISNNDASRFIKVKVAKTEVFPDWESAVQQYWQNDFVGLYQSIEEALFACKRFYSQEDVEKYGIIVFTINKIDD